MPATISTKHKALKFLQKYFRTLLTFKSKLIFFPKQNNKPISSATKGKWLSGIIRAAIVIACFYRENPYTLIVTTCIRF